MWKTSVYKGAGNEWRKKTICKAVENYSKIKETPLPNINTLTLPWIYLRIEVPNTIAVYSVSDSIYLQKICITNFMIRTVNKFRSKALNWEYLKNCVTWTMKFLTRLLLHTKAKYLKTFFELPESVIIFFKLNMRIILLI